LKPNLRSDGAYPATANKAAAAGWVHSISQRAQQQALYDAYAQQQGATPLQPDQAPGFLSRLMGAFTGIRG
jgi:hypothetical protein